MQHTNYSSINSVNCWNWKLPETKLVVCASQDCYNRSIAVPFDYGDPISRIVPGGKGSSLLENGIRSQDTHFVL